MESFLPDKISYRVWCLILLKLYKWWNYIWSVQWWKYGAFMWMRGLHGSYIWPSQRSMPPPTLILASTTAEASNAAWHTGLWPHLLIDIVITLPREGKSGRNFFFLQNTQWLNMHQQSLITFQLIGIQGQKLEGKKLAVVKGKARFTCKICMYITSK